MQNEVIGAIPEDKLAALQAANPGGFSIVVNDKNGLKHIAYFRDYEMADLNFAASQTDPDSPLDYNRSLMEETWLDGDRDIMTDKFMFMAASKKMNKRIDGAKAQLSEW